MGLGFGGEGALADEQDEGDDAEGPDVLLLAHVARALEDLGRGIVQPVLCSELV